MSLARRVTVAQRHVSQAYIKESRPKWLQLLLDVSASRPIRNTKVFDVSVNQNIILLLFFFTFFRLTAQAKGPGKKHKDEGLVDEAKDKRKAKDQDRKHKEKKENPKAPASDTSGAEDDESGLEGESPADLGAFVLLKFMCRVSG
jgi:hypothetical protein